MKASGLQLQSYLFELRAASSALSKAVTTVKSEEASTVVETPLVASKETKIVISRNHI